MKIDKSLAKYRVCRVITDNLLYGVGIKPDHENTSILCKCVSIYGLCVLIIIAIKCLSGMMLDMDNISKMVYELRGVTAAVSSIIRMASYLLHRKEFIFLKKQLCIKFEEELDNVKNRAVLLKRISLYRNSIYFTTISMCVIIALFYIPFIITVFKYKKYVELYPGKYPFTVEPGGTAYWGISAMEFSSCWFFFAIFTGIDNTFGIYCFQISSFLRLAIERFKNLNADDPKYKDTLRECVLIHQLVLRAKVSLENAYGYIVIWNYLSSAATIVSVLWELDQAKAAISVTYIIYALSYILLKLSQSFFYAYFGSIIITQSEEYQDAIYMSNWPGSGNLRLMKEILIILLQKPINLKACGFFFITMQYFEKICRATLSYFCLLQTLAEK